MDIGILFGFLGTWALVGWALFTGSKGNIGMYVDVPSVVIVVGASLTIVFFCFPMGKVKNIIGATLKIFLWKGAEVQALIDDMVRYAEVARRDGILSLEAICREIEDPFVAQALQMAVDGTDPELVEQIMTTDIDALIERHESNKGIWEAVNKYAPAMGMIGTLVGLVAMLADLSDPSAIGAGLAVALLTTLYGAMVSNMLAGPMADRLGKRSAEEVMYRTIVIKGVMAIQSGDNPRLVEQKLRSFLPPSLRKVEEEAA
ncbi:MAG: MotA/TolQ/ExbB proton channel family protein [Algisphaera sp.]